MSVKNSVICGVKSPERSDYLEIVKFTLLEFFECIKNTLSDKEVENPERFKKGPLNLKPSIKMAVLQALISRTDKVQIAKLYVWFIIDNIVADDNGNDVCVETFLTERNEQFILKYIFQLLPAAKKDDIDLFSEIWRGIDSNGIPTKFVKLSNEEKKYAWKYFDTISKNLYKHMDKYGKESISFPDKRRFNTCNGDTCNISTSPYNPLDDISASLSIKH